VDLVAGNSGECGQSVVSRLLRILETFSPERPELTTAEISRRSGVPASTVYRLLAELIGRGVVERMADGRYSVGLRLWEIGKLAPRGERLTAVASPYLHDLYAVTRGNVHLAVRVGGDALYLAAVCGHRCAEPVARAGTRVPLTSTSVGQVLLAYSRSPVLDQILENVPETAIASSAESRTNGLRGVLAGIRRLGVAVARAGDDTVVAAPVFGSPGELVAALALSAPDGAPPSLVPMVRMTAHRISQELLPADAAAVDDGLRRVAGLARGDAIQHGRTARAAPDRGGLAGVSFLSQ
jgi:DNA-binding IclR family transcriptional regulator